MNLFLDSSALIKRYRAEEGTELINAAMQDAEAWIASRLAFVETFRIIESEPGAPVKAARRDWEQVDVIEVDELVCERATALTGRHPLRTLDAIHLASALSASSGGLTFATWDRRLHAAAAAEGLATLPAAPF